MRAREKKVIRVGDRFYDSKRNIWEVTGTRPGGKLEMFDRARSYQCDRYHRDVKDWERVPVKRNVIIPAIDEHCGILSIQVLLEWKCPTCERPRGEPTEGFSFDGSRRLACHTWINPCGHVDKYSSIRAEARLA